MPWPIKGDIQVLRRIFANVGINIPNWATATDYLTDDLILDGTDLYLVIADHTSSASITSDLANLINLSPKDEAFADEGLVLPAIAGQPTEGEIATFASTNNVVDTLIYYTGTGTNTDPVTYLFYVDASGNVREIKSPVNQIKRLDNVITYSAPVWVPTGAVDANKYIELDINVVGTTSDFSKAVWGFERCLVTGAGGGNPVKITASGYTNVFFKGLQGNSATPTIGTWDLWEFTADADTDTFIGVQLRGRDLSADHHDFFIQFPETGEGEIVLFSDEVDGGFRAAVVNDLDTATTAEYRRFYRQDLQAGQSMLFQFDFESVSDANHVIRLGIENNSDSTFALIDIGTTPAASRLISSTDVGLYTGSYNIEEIDRGTYTLVRVSLTLTSSGDPNGVSDFKLSPVYNKTGSSTQDVSATGFIKLIGTRRGAPSEFVDAAVQSILVNSSGAVDSQVLPAAVGSGQINYYVNEDVMSNDATLTPQAGESLNGVTDGVFYFSNFPVGTQFRADDRGVGEWVVSVVGAANTESLHYYDIRGSLIDHTTTTTLTDTLIPLGSLQSDTAGSLTQNLYEYDPNGIRTSGTDLTIKNSGVYQLRIDVQHSEDSIAGVNGQNEHVGGVSGYLIDGANPVYLAIDSDQQGGNEQYMRGETLIELNAGQVLTFFTGDFTSARSDEDYYVHITLVQLPAAQSVLAGMIEPEQSKVLLGSATGVIDGGTVTISDTWGNLVNDYERVEFQMIGTSGSPLVPYRFSRIVETANWVDDTAVIFLSDAISFHRLTNMDVAGNTADVGISATDNSVTAATFNIYGIKSQQNVVNVGDVPVEDLVNGFVELATNTAFTASYSDVLTLNLPKAGTYRISSGVSYNFDVNSSPNRVRLAIDGVLVSGTEKNLGDTDVATGNWRGSTFTEKVVTVAAPSVLSLQAAGQTGGGANVIYSSADGNTTLAFEQMPQKTVVNDAGVPVDDQAASGYMDIGGMRMQWGSGTTTGTTLATITFPIAFPNTNYSVVASVVGGGNGQNVTIQSKTVTGFTVTTVDVNGTAQNRTINYQATGTNF